MHRDLTLERFTERKLNPVKIEAQLLDILRVVSRNKVYGVKGKVSTRHPEPIAVDGGYRYSFTVRMVKDTYRSVDAVQVQFDKIEKNVSSRAGRHGWCLVLATDKSDDIPQGQEPNVAQAISPAEMVGRQPFKIGTLTQEVLRTEFEGIYERDAHIRTIHSSTEAAVKTGFQKRSHTLLYGEPAAAKTRVFESLKAWYEKEGNPNRVMILDATTTTKAGLEKLILERAQEGTLPEILCLEEIEKYEPNNLLCLLAIMDQRGKIQRTNAKIGTVSASARMVIWATCNDPDKLQSFQRGAVWSRFNIKLECVRPSRELMHKILLDEVTKMDGNPAWAAKAVDFAFDVLHTDDPRETISILDGQDRLLNGEYQADRIAILNAAEQKRQERRRND